MPSTGVKTYKSIPEFLQAYRNEAVVQRMVKQAYGAVTEAELCVALEQVVQEMPEDKVLSLNVTINEPLNIAGYAIPGRGLECMLVGVFCRGRELIARYSINGQPVLDLLRTPESASCFEIP